MFITLGVICIKDPKESKSISVLWSGPRLRNCNFLLRSLFHNDLRSLFLFISMVEPNIVTSLQRCYVINVNFWWTVPILFYVTNVLNTLFPVQSYVIGSPVVCFYSIIICPSVRLSLARFSCISFFSVYLFISAFLLNRTWRSSRCSCWAKRRKFRRFYFSTKL